MPYCSQIVGNGVGYFAPHGAGAPAVFSFWHEHLPLMPALAMLARRSPSYYPAPIHTLVSRHRDGQFIGAVVRQFGIEPVLGSSSRGGAIGLRQLLNLLLRGAMIGITPDGPRGPRRQAAKGVAQLAALAGVPILPCAARTSRRIVLNTWDHMSLPLPFGRGVVVCGPAIAVPRDGWRDALPAITAAMKSGRGSRGSTLREPLMAGTVLEPLWAGATTVASPALRLLLRYRASRGKEIAARLAERRGIDPTIRPNGKLIWLHAASVGETVSVLPVLGALAEMAEDATMLVTTGTVTSAGLLEQRLASMGLATRVMHRFVPLDVPAWVGRFLDHWQPDMAGFVESELWPNILSACRARSIPAMLINARMSARSHAAWSRVPWAAHAVLRGFARIHARGEEDARRLRALGAERVEVWGDLKLASPRCRPIQRCCGR